jgi:hypothetical protein
VRARACVRACACVRALATLYVCACECVCARACLSDAVSEDGAGEEVGLQTHGGHQQLADTLPYYINIYIYIYIYISSRMCASRRMVAMSSCHII